MNTTPGKLTDLEHKGCSSNPSQPLLSFATQARFYLLEGSFILGKIKIVILSSWRSSVECWPCWTSNPPAATLPQRTLSTPSTPLQALTQSRGALTSVVFILLCSCSWRYLLVSFSLLPPLESNSSTPAPQLGPDPAHYWHLINVCEIKGTPESLWDEIKLHLFKSAHNKWAL